MAGRTNKGLIKGGNYGGQGRGRTTDLPISRTLVLRFPSAGASSAASPMPRVWVLAPSLLLLLPSSCAVRSHPMPPVGQNVSQPSEMIS